MTAKLIHEIFTEFTTAQTKEEKINALQRNKCWALTNVLKGAFDPNIIFTVKELPRYVPMIAPDGFGYSTIHQELGRAYIFEQGNPRVAGTLSDNRKGEILCQILENLEAKEAAIFGGMIMKKLDVPGLTPEIVKEAFPDLLP